jgi:hypothetical protein
VVLHSITARFSLTSPHFGVGVANPLFFLWRALRRPSAPASQTKSRRTAEESRTIILVCRVFNLFKETSLDELSFK